MHFGSPEFVLSIIGMAMLAGVLKTAIRAKHGIERGSKNSRRQEFARLSEENSGLVTGLREENARLTRRLESYEDRLVVLERIVTDGGYTLSREIEALRDQRRPEETN